MTRILAGLVTCVAVLLAGACGGGDYSLGSSAPAPTDVVVAAGDSSATVTWTMAPGVDYWVMFAPTDSITTANWTSFLGARSVIKAVSPQLIGGLVNGATYAFTVNGRVGNGPGGPGSASQAIVPRIAGAIWVPGSPLSSGDLLGAGLATAVTTVDNFSTVTYNFFAVGAGGKIFSGSDGKTWAAQNSTVSADLRSAVFGGIYVAAGANGTIVESADATTWSTRASGTSSTLNGLATNGAGTYVAVGAGGSITTTTDGGATWKLASSGTTQDLFAITYGSSGGINVFVAVGAQGTMLISADGLAWSAGNIAAANGADLKGIAFTPTTFLSGLLTSLPTWIAVGSGGTIISSNDASTWTLRASGSSNTLNAVNYNTRFVAVGDAGTVVTSDDDGLSWQAQASKTSANLTAITHNPYGYVVVGAAGTNLTAF